jgi:hypothetical protein
VGFPAENRPWFTSTRPAFVVYRPSWRELFVGFFHLVCVSSASSAAPNPLGFGSGERSLFSLHWNFNCARDNPIFCRLWMLLHYRRKHPMRPPILRNVHPAWRGYVQNVIIHFQSLRFESPSQRRLFNSSPAVPFVAPNVYDTVVLVRFIKPPFDTIQNSDRGQQLGNTCVGFAMLSNCRDEFPILEFDAVH